MPPNKKLEEKIDNRDYSEQCLACGNKKLGKSYHFYNGQLEPNEAWCDKCGFSWQQVELNFINRIYKEAYDYTRHK